MRVKPWPIIIIALIHIFAPVFNILWTAQMNHITSYDYIEYVLHNQNIVENFFWFIFPMFVGISILKFRKWSYYLILSSTLMFSVLLIYEFFSSRAFPLSLFLLFEFINLIVFSYFLLPAVRNVYLNKNLRWWEQKPRYLIDHPVQIKYKEQAYSGVMKNISEGGCLIETTTPVDRLDSLFVSFEIFQRKFQTQSQCVFKGREGVGVFFTEVHPSQNDLSKLIDQLAIQGYPLRTRIPNWTESFSEWIHAFIKGKGFVPQLDTKDSVVINSSPKEND